MPDKILHKEVTVQVSVEVAWSAWSTSEGMARWWAKDAWIELRLGGPFELYFILDNPRGMQGSEGCRILSFLPPEMLSFSWNFPPSIPEIRSEHTWIVLRFHRLGTKETRVTLDQLGWKTGSAWDEGWKYFDDAWGRVFDRFRGAFSEPEKRAA